MIGAVDIGGTKIAIGIIDRQGNVISKSAFPTEAYLGPVNSINKIGSWFNEFSKINRTKLDGIGIGCTGPVYPRLGEIGELDFLSGWKGFNIVDALSSLVKVDVALENDADAAALGEWAWGCGKNSKRFVMVTVGTGIGVGLIIEGKVYRGVGDSHPEIGHHFIDPDGPVCSCGGKGCWESLASGPAMEKWAEIHHPGNLFQTAKELCRMAELGDPFAVTVINRTANFLAIGISNIITFLCPDMIVITGGLMSSGHLFYPQIISTANQICGYVPVENVKITLIHPEQDIGLRGAAQVYIQYERWIEVN